MKTLVNLLQVIIFAVLVTGCSKTDAPVLTPQEQAVKYLVGDGNRVWRLKQIFVNNAEQALTDYQKTYTKTYTIDPAKPTAGKFENSDRLTGTWRIGSDGLTLTETFVSAGGVGIILPYQLNDINATLLDMAYASNNKIVREVYYAY